MRIKETVTPEDIKSDIKNSLKEMRTCSKIWNEIFMIIAIIHEVIMVAFLIFDPLVVLIDMVVCAVLAVVVYLTQMAVRQFRSKSVSIRDYDVSVAVLAYKEEEHYQRWTNRPKYKYVDNYSLWFGNKSCWRVPKKNYSWSAEYPMEDSEVYRNAHSGTEYIVVRKKGTRNIAMAYNTEYFEYKERR